MKIHVFGNVLNWGMGFAHLLREGGHDVRLFINSHEPSFYHPRWEYPEFSPVRFPFVEFVDIRPLRLLAGGRGERSFLRRLADCDVVQTFGEYSMWPMLAGCPYVTFSYGADLESIACGHPPWPAVKRWLFKAIVRRSFRRAGVFVYALPKHHRLVHELQLTNAVWCAHGVPIDTRRYTPYPADERRALRAAFPERWVFLHAARQEWTRRAANDKANDRLFEGFARFLRASGGDARLIVVRKGRDVGASEQLIARLGIATHIQWIEELDKPQLVRVLNSVDAFCDQFAHGYFGVASLEALACGVPTFVYINRAEASGVDLPPVFTARTSEEIAAALSEFAARADHEELRASSRQWVVAHHSYAAVRPHYEQFYQRSAAAGLAGTARIVADASVGGRAH